MPGKEMENFNYWQEYWRNEMHRIGCLCEEAGVDTDEEVDEPALRELQQELRHARAEYNDVTERREKFLASNEGANQAAQQSGSAKAKRKVVNPTPLAAVTEDDKRPTGDTEDEAEAEEERARCSQEKASAPSERGGSDATPPGDPVGTPRSDADMDDGQDPSPPSVQPSFPSPAEDEAMEEEEELWHDADIKKKGPSLAASAAGALASAVRGVARIAGPAAAASSMTKDAQGHYLEEDFEPMGAYGPSYGPVALTDRPERPLGFVNDYSFIGVPIVAVNDWQWYLLVGLGSLLGVVVLCALVYLISRCLRCPTLRIQVEAQVDTRQAPTTTVYADAAVGSGTVEVATPRRIPDAAGPQRADATAQTSVSTADAGVLTEISGEVIVPVVSSTPPPPVEPLWDQQSVPRAMHPPDTFVGRSFSSRFTGGYGRWMDGAAEVLERGRAARGATHVSPQLQAETEGEIDALLRTRPRSDGQQAIDSENVIHQILEARSQPPTFLYGDGSRMSPAVDAEEAEAAPRPPPPSAPDGEAEEAVHDYAQHEGDGVEQADALQAYTWSGEYDPDAPQNLRASAAVVAQLQDLNGAEIDPGLFDYVSYEGMRWLCDIRGLARNGARALLARRLLDWGPDYVPTPPTRPQLEMFDDLRRQLDVAVKATAYDDKDVCHEEIDRLVAMRRSRANEAAAKAKPAAGPRRRARRS